MFWGEIWRILQFLSENFQFLMVKFSVYLNRHVFIMTFRGGNWQNCFVSLLKWGFFKRKWLASKWCKFFPFRADHFSEACRANTFLLEYTPLRKHTYSKILKISPPKTENFQTKNAYIFHVSAQNIDCGYSLEPPRWGGSNEYPQSMFLSRNKKNNVYPCKPQFYYIKVGFKGVKII